ncbi:hypothetical protein N7U66_17775 [Lacinutrix neustonica]|uniref:Uncharacterized protein n=1 Tax=Lacinutrix neustonica TaxID=2980107 RepID=A0A9E8MVB9_9FLAO|nr:hypothetical protein [Lacinutrix neustonica]WAC01726.1 hypothetical protein N7U66_17775 [Lacinutrix neustonica]
MTIKTIKKISFTILILLVVDSCMHNDHIGVFNYDNKQELSQYNTLHLDATHPNLLNPKISTSDYNLVVKSWSNLHQRIGDFLSKNNFDWEVEDHSIAIVHKIYFSAEGKIKNYFFKVLTENVSEEKKEQFASLILKFSKDNPINFKKEGPFAQCGKTKYLTE